MSRNMSFISLAAAVKGNAAVEHYLRSENIAEALEYKKAQKSVDRLKTELMMKLL